MSDACYCDYEPNEFYEASTRTARKQHKCYECGKAIMPGEKYEYVAAKTDGSLWTGKTCPRCLALREWMTAHVPCFCWYHGHMLEDAHEEMVEGAYHLEVPGIGMEYGRLRIAIRRGPPADRQGGEA